MKENCKDRTNRTKRVVSTYEHLLCVRPVRVTVLMFQETNRMPRNVGSSAQGPIAGKVEMGFHLRSDSRT